MKRLSWMAAGLALLCALPAHAQTPERLRLQGSNVLGEDLAPALVQAWLAESGYDAPSTRRRGDTLEIAARRGSESLVVEIRGNGSAGAFAGLVAGDAEVGMSARPPDARELDAAWLIGKLRSPDQEYVVALDGLRIVVHPDNPLQALSQRQLRDVFAGRVRDWSQLGGRAGAITVVGLVPRSGNHELLSQLVLDGGRQHAGTRVVADSRALAAAVAADPRAIGYLPLRAEPAGVRALAVSAGADAVAPTRVNLAAEDYPLVRRLYFYGAQMMSALGRSFAVYAVSPAGQRVVASRGHVALSPQPLPAAPTAGPPAEYAQMLEGAHRLNVTLRFGSEYTILDSRGVQDLERLAAFMAEPANRGRELMLMGFADADTGGPAAALFLSHDRVDFVADQLRKAGLAVTRQRGFGGSAPLFAGDRDRARYVNERIELWLR